MKSETPKGYEAPLKTRAAIVAWLLAEATHNPRPGYGLFCFNVKCHDADLSFDNLVKVIGSDIPDDGVEYLADCRARYGETDKDQLWQNAVEDAGRDVLDKDQPGYKMLWDGPAESIAKWEFEGRSGGWLVLTEFDGVTLDQRSTEVSDLCAPESEGGQSFKWLRRLYRYLVQCRHDFRPEAIKREIEYKAASTFFFNICSDIKTTKQRADELVAVRQQAQWDWARHISEETAQSIQYA